MAEETARREAAEAEQRRLAAVIPPTAIRLAAPAAAAAAATEDLPATRILPSSGLGGIAVDWAMQQLGKPYEYGGSGPDSFDCSGLTMRAWGAAGVSLSHGADIQWYESTRVSVDDVIPGDLLFFGDSVEGIHHVAMYIGDGADDRGVHHRHPHPHPGLALGRPRRSRPTGLSPAESDQQYRVRVGYGFS